MPRIEDDENNFQDKISFILLIDKERKEIDEDNKRIKTNIELGSIQ